MPIVIGCASMLGRTNEPGAAMVGKGFGGSAQHTPAPAGCASIGAKKLHC
jgi:hypothetical protein